AVGCGSEPQSCSDTFDVSSPFTFGQPIAIGMLNQGSAVAQPYKDIWVQLMLTGFSVYDAAGYPVPNVLIAPQGADVNFFGNGPLDIPEPGTWLLVLSGSLALCASRHSRHRFRREATSYFAFSRRFHALRAYRGYESGQVRYSYILS
ncbi:MAG: hypothetical protein ACRD3W_17950, partial [Terriglobales bacterium]